MEFWTIVLSIISAVLLYYYFSKKENYFDKHGMSYIKPYPFVGNMGPVLLRQIPRAECIQAIYNVNRDAKYVGFFDFRCPTIMIRDLEIAKNITIKNFDHFVNHHSLVDPKTEPLFANSLFSLHDDQWRQIRNLLSPIFTSSKMKGMFVLMSECAQDFVHYFVEKSENYQYEVNSNDAFTRYVSDIIGSCVFGLKINSMRDPNNEFYVFGRKATNFDGILSVKFPLVRSFPRTSKFFNIKIVTDDVEKFFTKLVMDTIASRNEKGIVGSDILQLMMETRKTKNGRILTMQEIIAHAFGFFFSGFHTTTGLMCFVAHQIAANEDIQMKLQKEVDDVFEECNGNLTYEAVNSMVYFDAVINETIRMFPIVLVLDRICNSEFELPPALPGKKPVMMKPGDHIWIPVYPLQRDSKYYENPDVFDPERFVSNNKLFINPTLPHLAFGQGPRMCIGNRFALLEIKILFVHLLHKCSIKLGKRMITPLQLSPSSFTMTAEGGFWLEFQPRRK